MPKVAKDPSKLFRGIMKRYMVDSEGKLSYRRVPLYRNYMERDIAKYVETLVDGSVLAISYNHGRTKYKIYKVLHCFSDRITIHIHSRSDTVYVYTKDSIVGLTLTKELIKEFYSGS